MHAVATYAQAPAAGFSPEPGATGVATDSSLALLLATNAGAEDLYFRELDHLVQKLSNKRRKADHTRIIKRVFDEGRRRFLHSYDKNYPHFNQLFTDRSYNCVTGTALYAWVLGQLGYAVQIHETATHAYLTVQTAHNVYLLDATDPGAGFVTGAAAAGKRALWYTGNELQKGASFNHVITFRQLCGLQYYNQGVVAFNARDYDRSLEYLQKALALYPQSARITGLAQRAIQYRREVLAYATGGAAVGTGSRQGGSGGK